MRLDKFLKEGIFLDTEISRSAIASGIKEGSVLVNGQPAKPSYALRPGDRIRVEFEAESERTVIPDPSLVIPVILEDTDVIALDKPAGIRVHPDSQEKKRTIANFLVSRYPEIAEVHDGTDGAWMRPGIVHRLDMDTSGVLVVARNGRSFAELKHQFQERETRKTYWALVFGRLRDKQGIIDKPLARAEGYRKQVIANNRTKTKIRPAVTEYRVLEEFGDCSLVEAKPKTGRMHQIRVHLASISHPIMGDPLYCPKGLREIRIRGAKRQLLHAKSLRFSLFGREYFLESELPKDFRRVLDEKRRKG